MNKTALITVLLLPLLLFAGCATVKKEPPEEAAPAEVKVLERQDKHREVAYYYIRRAREEITPRRQDYLLRAVDSLLKGNYTLQAKNTLFEVDVSQLDRSYFIRKRLLSAEIAMQLRQPEQVLNELQPLEDDGLSAAQGRRFYELRSTAYTMLGDLFSATRERIELDKYLEYTDNQRSNRDAVLGNLIKLSEGMLQQFHTRPGETAAPDVTSRLEQRMQLEQLTALIEAWRQHDLDEHSQDMLQLIQSSLEQLQAPTLELPGRIALLLPLSGHFALAGEAIRDGILAAHYATQHDSMAPILRVYDTGGNRDQAWQAYQQAVSDGASFIIGPLDKDAVASLGGNKTLPIPTLALNYAIPPEQAPRGVYQFGLSPENEAEQVAERAWQDGRQRVVALIPDNDWGGRIASSFLSRWQSLAGETAAVETYDASQNDFSGPIRHAFNLDQSEQRHKQLRRLLGGKIEFTPRRRQDVDFIFIAAYPRQARQLRPQIKFHYAGDLPVYMTSHAFSGEQNALQDRDMDGVIFGDMPWTLGGTLPDATLPDTIRAQWPDIKPGYWRLYALGADAYALSAYLANMPNKLLTYHGNTGRLFLDNNNQINRQLSWAVFRNGLPRRLE